MDRTELRVESCLAPDGHRIGLGVAGTGPPLALAAWWVSHVERDWRDSRFRGFIESLAASHTVVWYDRPGVGTSDRERGSCDLPTETLYLRTVVDHLGVDRFDLLGISCGGPPSVALAAESPERVRRLVLVDAYVDGGQVASPEVQEAFVGFVRANWGMGAKALTDMFFPNATADEAKALAAGQRHVATAAAAADLLALGYSMDASALAPLVQAPTLVLHRRKDKSIHHRLGEAAAAAIPGARFMTLDGNDHLPWHGDSASVVGEVQRFLTGRSLEGISMSRALATVMFTDIVDSTRLASERGDLRWRRLLDVHDAEIARHVDRFGGRVVKTTGDGVLAVFQSPGSALEAAMAIRQGLLEASLSVRVGLHAGEVESRGDDIAGLAVHVAARIQALANAGEVLVSSTVKELVVGSGLTFADRGEHELRGIPDSWRLYVLDADT